MENNNARNNGKNAYLFKIANTAGESYNAPAFMRYSTRACVAAGLLAEVAAPAGEFGTRYALTEKAHAQLEAAAGVAFACLAEVYAQPTTNA